MRERAPLLLLLGSALTFLASLYLPWQTGSNGSCGPGCVEPAFTVDAWSSGIGDAAALAGLALAAVAAAALVRPGWSRRLPLARCSLAVGYLTLAAGAAIRRFLRLTSGHPPVHWADGSYLGVASAGLAVCVVALIRRRDVPPRPSASAVVFALLGLGLLASFLLPWYRPAAGGPGLFTYAILYPPAMLAALALAFGGPSETRRLGSAATAALLTGAAFSANTSRVSHAYGAWLGSSLAIALLVFAAVAVRSVPRRPTGSSWAATGVAAVFVASLFMPWQTFCAPAGSNGFGPGLGRCVSANGWGLPNSTAAVLVVLVAAAPALWLRRISKAELAVGAALLVATAGLEIGLPAPARFAYGAFVGFVAAGGIVLLTLTRLRPPPLGRRLLPVAASSLFVLGVLLPWWLVLPSAWQRQSDVLTGWLAVAGLLLSLHLLASWLGLAGRSLSGDGTLMLVPVSLLALVVLEIGRSHWTGMTWGSTILIALCVLLALLGWVEESGGRLERLRMPQLLRVDRLPGAEG